MTARNTLHKSKMIVGYSKSDAGRKYPVDVKLELYEDKGNLVLSLVGWHNGPGGGGGGQMQDRLQETIDIYDVPENQIDLLVDVWNRWHLNDMKAGCSHQREWMATMIEAGIVPDDFFYASNYENVVAIPGFGSCTKCSDGYRYGSAWVHETLSADAVEFLLDLFDVDVRERKAVMGCLNNEIKNKQMLEEIFG